MYRKQKKVAYMMSRKTRGGPRVGAGRKKGGKYMEPTHPVRLPTRGVPYFLQLVDAIWSFLKTQPHGEDLLPSIFDNLHRSLSESLSSTADKATFSNDERAGILMEQDFQNNLIPMSSISLVGRKPLTRDQRSRMYPSTVAASFDVTSTSEQDNPGKLVDLHQMLVKEPSITFLLPVAGDSMNKAGIHDGDLVVVQQLTDSWSQLKNGTIVTALVNGSQTIKRFEKIKDKAFLLPESDNPEHQPLEIRGGMNVSFFGIVMYSIHSINKRYTF
ncbi:LexA family protein [Leptolyngbya sp. AN02str]|uniref:LexA family protein n=1 Tax=Leptolyngbya sp. AN02str TaxID=3423363 RepID=UPI003D31C31B